MPFANKEQKKAHNIKYKTDNKWILYAKRIVQTNQKSVSKTTYENLKDIVPSSFWNTVKVKGTLKQTLIEQIKVKPEPIVEQESVIQVEKAEPLRKTTRSQVIQKVNSRETPSIYTIDEAIRDINAYSGWGKTTREGYTSKLKTMMSLLGCNEHQDIV